MAEDGYEYVIGMKDQVSDAASQATKSLNNLQGALNAASKAQERAAATGNVSSYRKATSDIAALNYELARLPRPVQHATQEIKKLDDAVAHAGKGAHEMASGISYAVRGFDDLARGGRYSANGVLDIGKAFTRLGPTLIGAAFVGGSVAIAKYAFDVSEAKEQTIEAFSVFQGSTAAGTSTFNALGTLADSVHAPAEKVAGLAKELLELGLTNTTQLLQTVRAVEDMQRVGLSAGAEKIKGVVERSLAAGHLVLGRGGASASRALAGTGISESDVAAQLGVSPKQLEAQLKAGKISLDDGLAAINHAIIEGKVGALATKKFTVSDAFTDLHNSIRKVFQEQDDSPITEALRRLTQNFADGTEGAKMLGDVIDTVFQGIGGAIDLADELGKAFGEAADFAKGVWESFGDVIATITKSSADQERILAERSVKRHAAKLGEELSTQQEHFEKVQDLAKSGASTAEIQRTAKRLGLDVSVLPPGAAPPHAREPESIRREMQGLDVRPEEGTFKARIQPEAKDQTKKLGQDTFDGFKDGVIDRGEIFSPSHVMHRIGVDAFAGLESGAEQGKQMFQQAPAGKGVAVHVDVGGIQLHGSIDHDDFMPLLESQVADVFERVALELGQ